MTANRTTRRRFLQTSAAVGAGVYAGVSPRSAGAASANGRLRYASIGLGAKGSGLNAYAALVADCAALCDVDSNQLEKARARMNGLLAKKNRPAITPEGIHDYQDVLQRDDIDFVFVATPDHWHAKIAIEAMRAGKDVYCEKPLTLTIAEGRQLLDVQQQTGRVVQVGTQQRSDGFFQRAVAMTREGRAGALKRITVALGGAPNSGALPVCEAPGSLDWDRWLGPAPAVAYRQAGQPSNRGYAGNIPYSRAHAHFRWWYEYSGGKMTDWGAHHVDIAMWAMGKSDGAIGPFTIDPLMFEHPVEFRDGMPLVDDRFNTATKFHIRVTFADGVELDLRDRADDLGFVNGVMFQGEEGRYFANRGKLVGKPVEELAQKPLAEETFESIYPGIRGKNSDHLRNFLGCIRSRKQPLSDVASHHRHLTVCHAANIAIRLGRKLTFDPAAERFVDDDLANRFLSRESRAGFETEVA